MTDSKPIPKSLHTVTVFVRVARLMRDTYPQLTVESALLTAMEILGYRDAPDSHGLRLAALKILKGK